MNICYSERQVAEMLSMSIGTLRMQRHRRTGIPFVKIGKCVRYRKQDIEAYLEANRCER